MNTVASLIDQIKNVVKQHTNISHLYSCISEGTIKANRGYVPNESAHYNYNSFTDWVRLIRLNRQSFTKWIQLKDCSYNNDCSKERYLTILNPNYANRDNLQSMFFGGVNIDTDIKLTGYHYNICEIFDSKYFTTLSASNNSIGRYTYKMLYVGEKNYIIGFIDRNAFLYLDNVLLTKILERSFTDFERVITRIYSVYANANALFFSLNIQNFENNIVDTVSKKLITGIDYNADQCTIIDPAHLDLFEDFSVVNDMLAKMKKNIKDQLALMLKDTRWGINNQYGYKKLVDELIFSSYKQECDSTNKAFMQGLLYGSKFEYAGWKVSEKKFDNRDAFCWEKEVDIIPSRFFYKREMYNINASDDTWQNPYKITKLYVSSEGVMYCEGKHPNVSSGRVCMGDINGKINMGDPNKLQSNLARCESLLTSINYDSPYDSSRLDEMLEHSVKVAVTANDNQSNEDADYVAQGTIIQNICFEDETPEDENPDDSDLHDENYEDSNEISQLM